jgi:NitT/TauT family transport system substrate-binding protein
MSKIKKISILLVLIAIVVFVLIKCDGKKKKPEQLTAVTLRLQWKLQAQFAGYYVALDKGYYRDAGLDVTIAEGGYGKDGIVTVIYEIEEFGTKWMADLIGENVDFISLANIVKKNGLVLISKKEKGIRTPEDFVGKRVSTWFIGNEYQLYSLLKKQNIPLEDVEIVAQKFNMNQFYDDKVDVASAMVYNELEEVAQNVYPPEALNIIDFADYNISFPGQCIFTSRGYSEKNPDICRKFTQASIKGWDYAIDHPEEAVAILLKYDKKGELDSDLQLTQMKHMINLIEREEYPIGWHRREDFEKIVEVFMENDVLETSPDIDKLYTNEFVKIESASVR